MKRFDVINSNWDHQVNCGGGMPRMPVNVAVIENKIYFKNLYVLIKMINIKLAIDSILFSVN